MELDCKRCGANFSSHSKKFFNGLKGLQAHMASCFKAGVAIEDVLDSCNQRRISDNDVRLMTGKPLQKPKDVLIRRKAAYNRNMIGREEESEGEIEVHSDHTSGASPFKTTSGATRKRSPPATGSSRILSLVNDAGTPPFRDGDSKTSQLQVHRLQHALETRCDTGKALKRRCDVDDEDDWEPLPRKRLDDTD